MISQPNAKMTIRVDCEMTKTKIERILIQSFACLMLLTLSSLKLSAQRDHQLWLDYQIDVPFANKFLFEATVSYQSLLSQDDKWRSFSVSPTLEYVFFTWLDLTAEVPLGYTFQADNNNTFEISPIVGGRFHITQNRRINTRFLMRYQQRSFRQVEAEDWDYSNRVRLKGEVSVSINHTNLFADKLWYAMLDYEEFFVLDQQLDERYANQRRLRLGLGYRLNYKHRFEVNYAWQTSRNEIEGEFAATDNLIWLKYKMFLNPSKPKPPNNADDKP